jgi:hypothetical protein
MRPPNSEIAHAFMLWFQERNGRPPSLTELAEALPFWKSRASAQGGRRALRARGLIEARQPEGGGRLQLWAVELCSCCEEIIRGPRHPMAPSWCARCCEEAFGTQVAFS